MKVYVITKGEYSDYHICAVALELEHAKKLMELFTDRCDEARIEVFDTDAPVDLLSGKKPYAVIFCENGEVRKIDTCDPEWIVGDEQIWTFLGRKDLCIHVAADDPAAAIKIAAEKRAKYLAEKAGIS